MLPVLVLTKLPSLVSRSSSGSAVVQADGVVCRFYYSTQGEEEAQAAVDKPAMTASEVMELLQERAVCVKKKQDKWMFGVCIGGKATQASGDETFVLGPCGNERSTQAVNTRSSYLVLCCAQDHSANHGSARMALYRCT